MKQSLLRNTSQPTAIMAWFGISLLLKHMKTSSVLLILVIIHLYFLKYLPVVILKDSSFFDAFERCW